MLHKKNILLGIFTFLVLYFSSKSIVDAYKIPSDSGRLSLIQVENNQIVNQRDGSFPIVYNFNYVNGRTSSKPAIFLPYNYGIITPIIQNNFNYSQGTVSFWINSNVWNDNLDHVFFALNADPRHTFAIWKQIDGFGNSIVRAGIDPDFITINASDISSNVWHLFTITYSPNNLTRFYVDGNLKGTSAEVYDGLARPAGAGYCYYHMCWGAHFFYTGNAQSTLEDMQTFNYPLSEQQILDIYNSTTPASFYNHIYPNVSNITFSTNFVLVNNQFTATALVDQVGYAGLYTYLWEWGDGTTSNTSFGQHTYSQSGEYVISLTVIDNEGDIGSLSKVITVQSSVDAIESLVSLVTSYNLQQGINNSLDVKLDNAQQALSDTNQNNDVAALNSLYAFINSVNAQRGNQITNEQADELINVANNIINSL